MRVNRAPRAAPSGRPAALRGRGRLPAHRLRHQHEGGAARRSRGAPPAAGPPRGGRIRCAEDTGLDRFPLQGSAANRVWCLIVALACDLLAFSQLLTLADAPARAWEPRTIRLQLMSIPAVIATTPAAPSCATRPTTPGPAFCLTASSTSRRSPPRRHTAPASCPPRP